jgi:hypothetical protein
MTEPLENSVAHLRAFSLHLNDVTDQATAAVRRVETFLNQECRLGLAVYVPVTAHAPDLPTLQLGYARTGERYRIVVRSLAYAVRDGEVLRHHGSQSPVIEAEEQVAWSECPRAIKLDAFQHLPALLTALQEKVADVIQRADAALAAAQRITSVLGEAPAPEAEEEGERGECDGRGEGRHHGHHHGHHGHHGHHHGHHGHDHHHDDRGPADDRGTGRHKHGDKPFGDKPREGGRRGWDRA